MLHARPSVRTLLALALALLLGAVPSSAAAGLRLRVVTWNLWGLPLVSANYGARMDRVGEALAGLEPQVVCVQEAWLASDQERVSARLAAAGLTSCHVFSSGQVGPGLMVCSAYPIVAVAFESFLVHGHPWRPWHADWYGNKGVGTVRLRTPLGDVDLAVTHLHAGYGTDEYLPFQVSQAVDVADACLDAEALDGASGTLGAVPPAVLCGDLNSRAGSVPYALLTSYGRMAPAGPLGGIDWIMTRSGGALSVAVTSAGPALQGPVALGEGLQGPLSDHPAVVADLVLTRGGVAGLGRERRVRPGKLSPETLARAKAVLQAGVAASHERSSDFATLGYALLGVAVPLVAVPFLWPGGRARVLTVTFLAALALAGGVGSLWLERVHEPQVRLGLETSLDRLGR